MSNAMGQRVATRRVMRGFEALGDRTLAQDVELARVVAKAMDSNFSIAGFKFGFDALIGLVPIAGDAISFVIGLFPIYVARKHGLGKVVIGRMMANLGLDFLVGLVPIAGDAADLVFKANLKNVAILERALAKRSR